MHTCICVLLKGLELGTLALCLSVRLFDSSEEAHCRPSSGGHSVATWWKFFLDLTSTDGSVSMSHSCYWLLTAHLLEDQSSPSCLRLHVLVQPVAGGARGKWKASYGGWAVLAAEQERREAWECQQPAILWRAINTIRYSTNQHSPTAYCIYFSIEA